MEPPKVVIFFLQILLMLLISAVTSSSESQFNIIKSLPGYSGNLPFTLETGYIGVGKSEEVQLFYYFIESERDVERDPLLLWLTGGPGCSAFSGLVFEIGPLTFNYSASYSESGIPKFQLNPYSWTKVASIIFLDSPVGSGFSYGTTSDAYYSDDVLQSQHIYEFLRKWLMGHSKFKGNPLYISGDSYSGKIVPIVVQEILNGNKKRHISKMNLKGYILGNPKTDDEIYINAGYEYLNRVSILSHELYETAITNCDNDFANINPNNTKCLVSFQALSDVTVLLNRPHILEHKCLFVSPKPFKKVPMENYIKDPVNFLSYKVSMSQQCRGMLDYWFRCNRTLSAYTQSVRSSINYHRNFKKAFLRSLVYSGDQDESVSYVDSQKWIKQLNLSIYRHWSPWFVDGQVAGYVTEYSHFPYYLTFATVKGGGHTAPEYKPRECLAMIDRWLGLSPL